MHPHADAPPCDTPGEPPDDADATICQLYSGHAKALHGYLIRFCPDSASADDIVQETFIRAWRHLPKLTADSRLVRPWLFRVAPQPADRCRPTATASRREATGEGAATEGTDDLAVSA